MRRYSDLFATLHDQPEPVGRLGRGAHYSVFRSVVWVDGVAMFHDFAVVWDEDHDPRVIWVVEQMFVRGLLGQMLVIGERKGGITVLTSAAPSAQMIAEVGRIADGLPGDPFTSEVQSFSEASRSVIDDDTRRVRDYLAGVHALWRLGTKPVEFMRVAPVGVTG